MLRNELIQNNIKHSQKFCIIQMSTHYILIYKVYNTPFGTYGEAVAHG